MKRYLFTRSTAGKQSAESDVAQRSAAPIRRAANPASVMGSRIEGRRLDSADDEFDRRLSIGGGRSVPLDDTGRDGLRAQPSLLDQGHDLGKQRSSMCPSDEEADPECVKPAEGHRHVARVEGHTLQNALRLRGSDGKLQARRSHTPIHYDGIAALRRFEIRLEPPTP